MAWRTRIAAFLAVLASLSSLFAQAQETLYAATGSGGAAGVLFTVNPANAATTSVGPILAGGLPIAMTGLAFQPSTGRLYGITASASPNLARHLVTIDTATGTATDIGALGVGGADISFAPNGTLYMTSGAATNIYTVNLATGAATVLGATGLVSLQGDGLAINGAAAAFLSNDNVPSGALATVNLTTGAATAGPAITGTPVAGALDAMAFNAGGALFAVDTNQAGPAATNNLVRINTATGAATNIGVLPNNVDALAFSITPASATIPTLGEWALLALALVLGAAGMISIGKRKA